MPSRNTIPGAGTRISDTGHNSVREVLAAMSRNADAARNVDAHGPTAAMTGRGGTQLSQRDNPPLALFELQSQWRCSDFQEVPGYTGLPKQYFYNSGYAVQFYGGQAKRWHTCGDKKPELIFHAAGYQTTDASDAGDSPRKTQEDLRNKGAFLPACGKGDWVWCVLDETAGVYQYLGPCETIIRGTLKEDLKCGATAKAVVGIFAPPDVGETEERKNAVETVEITVHDALALVANSLVAEADKKGNLVVKKGGCFYAKRFADNCHWEIIQFGGCNREGTGSSSGRSSSSSSSSSSGSGHSGSSSSSSRTCDSCDLSGPCDEIPGWEPNLVQVLGHDEQGCLKWY